MGNQSLVFSIDTQEGPRFGIDHLSFNPNRVDRTLKLGAVDEWTLTSAVVNHRLSYPRQCLPNRKDSEHQGTARSSRWSGRLHRTRRRPPSTAIKSESFETRSSLNRVIVGHHADSIPAVHPEQFVLHCHILDHEDQGMMQLLEIVPGSGDLHHVHL